MTMSDDLLELERQVFEMRRIEAIFLRALVGEPSAQCRTCSCSPGASTCADIDAAIRVARQDRHP